MSKIKYKIKTATEEAILIHLRECSGDFSPPLADRVDIEKYSRKIFTKSITFEAWDENLLVGLIAAYFSEGAECSVFITNVSVLKVFMNQGVASELISNCIEYAIQKNFTEMNLEVNKENSHAIGLYRKFNFTDNGENNGFLSMKTVLGK